VIKPITKLDMLRYRASCEAERIKDARAQIKAAEAEVREAKQIFRNIQQQISACNA